MRRFGYSPWFHRMTGILMLVMFIVMAVHACMEDNL